MRNFANSYFKDENDYNIHSVPHVPILFFSFSFFIMIIAEQMSTLFLNNSFVEL